MSARLVDVRRFMVSAHVVAETMKHLRARGGQRLEGMAVWAGVIDDGAAMVRGVVIPRQQGHRTEHGLAVTVAGEDLHQMNVWLYRNSLRLLIQVHSHPTEAYHSETDDLYSVVTELGALSIVIPDFAAADFTVAASAVHRLTERPWWHLTSRPWWRALGSDEAERLLVVEG